MNPLSVTLRWALAMLLSLTMAVSQFAVGSNFDAGALEHMIADGQAESLVSTMEQHLETEKPSAEAHYWLARGLIEQIEDAWVLRKLSLARDAREHLETALALDEQHVPTRFALGRFYIDAPAIAGGSRANALEQIDALMDLEPSRAYALKAAIANADEAFEDAIGFERKALAAGDWEWDAQYELVIRSVFFEVTAATEILNEAESNIRTHADAPERLLPLIGYQRGKLAATTGQAMEAGLAGLTLYLQHTPSDDEPAHEWAEFRMAQIERQLGRNDDATARLARLEAMNVEEDLGFALQDERRWHYGD